MDYYNEKPNSWLHKRQAPATGDTNTNIQPFPNSPPSPNNNSTSPENAAKSGGGGGISKSQLTGIIAGVLIVLVLLIGIFLRKKLVRERTRNAIRIDDIEWDSRLPKKTIRLQQQSRGVVYNERGREGEKIMSSMVVQNSPTGSQFSNFYSPRETPSDPNISSPLGSKFNLNSQSRRFQQPENGPYHHLPRSPRSPLMFKNKTFADSDYDDEDTLKGTPRSPYFFKDESVPKNTNDQYYADDEIGKAVPLAPPPPIYNNNNYNNVNISNENRAEYTYSNIKKRNDIISQLDSDLDNIITKFQDNNNHLDRQYGQYTNDLPPSFVNPNDDTLALSLPSPFKLSWTKDSSYFNNSLLAPITSTNEESNRPNSQTTISTYSDSESRSNSIGIKGTNQNVQMDYVQPNQGMIQIEMIDDHIITKNEMLKESIRTNEFEQEPVFEFVSPHSMQPYAEPNMDVEYVGFEQEPEFEFVSPRSVQPYAEPNLDVKYVDNESRQIVEPYDISNVQPRTIQPIETNMKTEKMYPEISAPVITGAAKPEILASKPIVTSVGPRSISPMYDIDSIRRHAEKVLNKKNVNKGGTAVNEIKKNDKNESEPQEKTLVRKKSVRFQAGPANEEAPRGSNANEESSEGSNFVTRKSILINKDDVINIQDTIQCSSLESDDEEANNRDSASSYQMYDFDISSYQDNRF